MSNVLVTIASGTDCSLIFLYQDRYNNSWLAYKTRSNCSGMVPSKARHLASRPCRIDYTVGLAYRVVGLQATPQQTQNICITPLIFCTPSAQRLRRWSNIVQMCLLGRRHAVSL